MVHFLYCCLLYVIWFWGTPVQGKGTEENILKICIKYPSKPGANKYCKVDINGSTRIFPAIDTCIHLSTRDKFAKIIVNTIGFFPEQASINFTETRSPASLNFQMREKVNELKEVVIKDKSPFSYKGDTLVIRPDSSVLRPHENALGLLEKTPGISISKDGNISVMGKEVSVLTVDGQPMFGGDHKATLQALKGNMIDRLEVLDKERVEMNIRLRKDKSHGIYGDFGVDAGTNRRSVGDFRVNSIAPKRFLNFFLNTNNINRSALSSDNSSRLFSSAANGNIYGVYSILRNTMNGGMPMAYGEGFSAPSFSPGDGVGRNTTAGMNYSRKLGKSNWNGFIVANGNSRFVQKNRNTVRFFDQIQQTEVAGTEDTVKNMGGWGALFGNITISKRAALKVSVNMLLEDQDQRQQSEQLSQISGSNGSEGLFKHQHNYRTKDYGTDLRTQYTQRYKKPSMLTSVFMKSSFDSGVRNQRYSNLLKEDTVSKSNNNLISSKQNTRYLDLQVVHDMPVARALMWEIRGDGLIMKDILNQNGRRIGSNSTITEIPGLSISGFVNDNRKLQLSTGLLYKLPKMNFVGTVGIWNWKINRVSSDTQYLKYQSSKASTVLFVDYHPDYKSKISAQYSSNNPVAPGFNTLVPLADSSRFQNVSTGNPLVVNYLQDMVLLKYGTSFNNKFFHINMSYKQFKNPVLSEANFNLGGFSTQTYVQAGAKNELDLNLFFTDANPDGPISYLTRGSVGRRRNANIVSGKVRSWYSYSYGLNGDFRYKGKGKISGNLILSYNASTQPGLGMTSQGEAWLKINTRLSDRFYGDISTQCIGTRNFDGISSGFLLSDIRLLWYFQKDRKLCASININNIFNVKNTLQIGSSDNYQQVESTNRLPRFFSVGLTYYFEKWKKSK